MARHKLSPPAQQLYDAFTGREWITYGDLKELLGPDVYTITKAWNELLAAGLAEGKPYYAEMGRVLKRD